MNTSSSSQKNSSHTLATTAAAVLTRETHVVVVVQGKNPSHTNLFIRSVSHSFVEKTEIDHVPDAVSSQRGRQTAVDSVRAQPSFFDDLSRLAERRLLLQQTSEFGKSKS